MVSVQSIGAYRLQSGVVLPDVQLAYVQHGQLNAAGDNAILVTHGYTSGPSMLSPTHHTAEGSWAPLLGPGGPLDTDRYAVFCINMLGSSFGSTGPATERAPGQAVWGADFPALCMADIVGSQHALLQQLGVRHLRAVLGPSYGGWQALQWALQFPERVDAIGAVVSGLRHPQGLSAQGQRARLAASDEWHGGQYRAHGGMVRTLFNIRWQTMQDYGLDRLYAERYADPAERHARMQAQCQQWAERFDPMSLVVLAHAAEQFDVRAQLAQLRCKLWFAVCSTDKIFPPDPETTALLSALHIPVRQQLIDSPYGHMASGIEWRDLQAPIRWLLDPQI